MNNLELKPMHTCSFETALEVWNAGFKGYVVDMTLTLDKLLDRLTANRVSPEHSLIAMDRDKPVGFLFNALQMIGDRKLAWNGGTGVIPEYRGKGVGKQLVQATIEIYRANNVGLASLEAISTNHAAINLYKRFGYEVVDELTYLQTTQPRFNVGSSNQFQVLNVHPSSVGQLAFYREHAAWQCQWHVLASRSGEAIVVLDVDNVPIGYALSDRRYDETGNVTRIALFQCEVARSRSDEKEVTQLMLERVLGNVELQCQRTTINFPKSNTAVIGILRDAGFATLIEQLHMIKQVH